MQLPCLVTVCVSWLQFWLNLSLYICSENKVERGRTQYFHYLCKAATTRWNIFEVFIQKLYIPVFKSHQLGPSTDFIHHHLPPNKCPTNATLMHPLLQLWRQQWPNWRQQWKQRKQRQQRKQRPQRQHRTLRYVVYVDLGTKKQCIIRICHLKDWN
jgi:hypothetical protein